MRLTINKMNKQTYRDLDIGDMFLADFNSSDIYMVTDTFFDEDRDRYNAVCIANGEFGYFDVNNTIYPITDVTITIE